MIQEEYKTRIHPMSQELSHLKNQSRAVRDEMEIYKRKCERKTNQLRQLNDKQSQMLETVRAKDRNAYNAHQWIKQNEARFKKRVYGPVVLDLNISSPVIASAFEQLCPNWLKFVCLLIFSSLFFFFLLISSGKNRVLFVRMRTI